MAEVNEVNEALVVVYFEILVKSMSETKLFSKSISLKIAIFVVAPIGTYSICNFEKSGDKCIGT